MFSVRSKGTIRREIKDRTRTTRQVRQDEFCGFFALRVINIEIISD